MQFFYRLLLPITVLLFGASVSAAHAADRKVSVCMSADNGAVDFTFRSTRLGNLDCATVYTTLGKEKLEYQKFPKEFGITLVLRIPYAGDGGNLADIKNGVYDDDYRALARKIKADGRPIMLRILPEFNGHWYSWHAFRAGNDPADFIPAWQHLVSVMREETKLVKFDLNYNRTSSKGGTAGFAQLYPGDEWVDRVSISSYNRCGSEPDRITAHSFAEEFAPAYDELLKIVGPSMPIAVAETSTTSMCGVNKKEWFADLFDAIETRFTRVENVTFFFKMVEIGKASNKVPLHWELQNAKEVNMFRKLLRDFRKRMGLVVPDVPVSDTVYLKLQGTHVDTSLMHEKPKHTGPRMPWTVSGQLEWYVPGLDSFNPEFNPVTGTPFGSPETRLRFKATQGIMWDVPGVSGLSYGAEVFTSGVLSTNPDSWWNNQLDVGGSLQLCSSDKPTGVDWGGICAFLEGKYTSSLGPVPERLDNGEVTLKAGVKFNYGGDWNK